MDKDDMRKGPWTEQEDGQLVFYVNLFGDRRWDFVAKVSGLKRTGKSCRLRWVNYLHPGLKRDKMTPHEERLVVELHSKWGNRWSRIARKLPGRTDNEIKNYWRTHTRKEAQDKKKKDAISQPSSSSSISSYSNSSSSGGKSKSSVATTGGNKIGSEAEGVYSMDEIWKDIELSEESSKLSDPVWDFCATGSLWSVDGEEESKMLMQQMGDHFHSFPFNHHI